MSRMSILNAPGQQTEGFCMVKSAALRTDSKGGAYMDMVLADAGGECVAKIWNCWRTPAASAWPRSGTTAPPWACSSPRTS